MSDSLRPYGQQPARLLCPWDLPGKNTRVGSHFLLQEIFSTQDSNPCLLTSELVVGSLSLVPRGKSNLYTVLIWKTAFTITYVFTAFSPQNNSFLQKIYLNPQLNGAEDNGNWYHANLFRASLISQLVKNPLEMQQTWVLSLGWEIPGEGKGYPLQYSWASLVAQLVKNLPAIWETWVPSLGWEDPLKKEKATHSGILAQRISWTI